jgi:transposase
MSMARLVVTAVRAEGRSISAVARDYSVSRRWIHELLRRYDTEGEPGLQPRSRRPHASPQRTPDSVQDEIVQLRKTLTDQGLDAGAHTIAYHLTQRHGSAPAPSTIWRILTRRGFVSPSPGNGRAHPGGGLRPTSPTSAGKPTSPTGFWPTSTAPAAKATVSRSRSSTCSTTTPAWPWPATPATSSRPLTCWPSSPAPSPPTGCRPRC